MISELNDYERIAEAINFIDQHFQDQPDLTTVAAHVGLSEYHFQRLFLRWAGISPKRFLQFLTAEYARDLLQESHTVLDAAYESGLSGPGRLHDLTVNIHAVTPGEIRTGGEGVTIQYGVHETPFGDAFIAVTARGICKLHFLDTAEAAAQSVLDLQTSWPNATFEQNVNGTRRLIETIFAPSEREQDQNELQPLSLWVKGTNFQVRVWEALLKIPKGQAATYQTIAAAIGQPTAARAVGNAVGDNPIAYLIPCHRVLRKSGAFGGYRWGQVRKQAIFGWEAATMAQTMPSG